LTLSSSRISLKRIELGKNVIILWTLIFDRPSVCDIAKVFLGLRRIALKLWKAYISIDPFEIL
tara:strand:+ start:272 stop:460 length:189 start_codon:yes stop_codon:yes gene_type:complete